MNAVSIFLIQRRGNNPIAPASALQLMDCWNSSYANGESEIAMGEAIQTLGWKRSDFVISTKVSNRQSIAAQKLALSLSCS